MSVSEKIELNKGEWSIQVGQQDLNIFGSGLLFKGKHASHSFLRLVDDQGRVVSEIHGGALDPESGSFGPMKFKLSKLFNAAGKGLTLLGINLEESTKNNPRLKVEVKSGANLIPSPTETTQIQAHGSKEQILSQWLKGIQRAIDINKSDLVYTPLNLMNETAQNCHSVTMDLIKIMTGNQNTLSQQFAQNQQKFATPGAETALTSVKNTALKTYDNIEALLGAIHRYTESANAYLRPQNPFSHPLTTSNRGFAFQ